MQRISRIAAVALMLLPLPPAAAAASRRERVILEYGCGDVVAVGRFKTLSYEHLSGPDDLLGHGLFSMRATLKQVLRGKEPRRAVPASGMAAATP